MQMMKSDAFLMAYLLCQSLVRGPEYIDAMTDPETYADKSGEDEEASACGDIDICDIGNDA